MSASIEQYVDHIYERELDAWYGNQYERKNDELERLQAYAEETQQSFEDLETYFEKLVEMLYSKQDLNRVDLDYVLAKIYTKIHDHVGCTYDMPQGLPTIQRA